MKNDRLSAILATLLQEEKVTAPYLAEKFGVARRTISRDIEALCQAGVPLVTTQGQNGGIALMEGHRLDREFLKEAGFAALAAGLPEPAALPLLQPGEPFLMELSEGLRPGLANRLEDVRSAIAGSRLIRFSYPAPEGEFSTRAEPYHLVFYRQRWHVWAFCLSRQEFTLFALDEMEDLRITGNPFQKRLLPLPALKAAVSPAPLAVKALFDPDCRPELTRLFGRESFAPQEDGSLLFHAEFPSRAEFFAALLPFGDRFTLLEPEDLRTELAAMGANMARRNGG